MSDFKNPEVAKIFDNYPQAARQKLLFLRQLIFQTAQEIENLAVMDETLKWGEPSYVVKSGSTVRIDWKSKQPTKYAMYFHCSSKLVDTFRELYPDAFTFEGNRAIVFDIEEPIAVDELKHCITLALTYHSRKHLPLLGA